LELTALLLQNPRKEIFSTTLHERGQNNAGNWTSKIAPPIIYGIQINTHIRERGGNNAGNYFENKQKYILNLETNNNNNNNNINEQR
jgi:hypothetical protein